ncbi:MAG TPA: NAD-dependent epimerase/dehydratase family protein [Gemmataceae bacterium]|nr:NAD-dependent epimerase/dehydratase family protein [Gemmataceae bacterium]
MAETALIIGGAGFIGSRVCARLVEGGFRVVVFDAFVQYASALDSNYSTNIQDRFRGIRDKVEFFRGDAHRMGELSHAFAQYQPDYVVHLASLPISNISNIYIEEAIEATIQSTSNILTYFSKNGAPKRFLYISSSMVYGDFQVTPASEEHPTNPKDIYGAAKLCGEVLTRAFGNRFGIPWTIIRPSAVYGPTDMNKRVSQLFIDQAIAGKVLTIKGGDKTKLDFTFVDDAAEGICLALLKEEGKDQVFNITCGEGRSLLEYADILRGYLPGLKIQVEPMEKHMPVRGTLDITRARKLLGFQPKYRLEDGIREYLKSKGVI